MQKILLLIFCTLFVAKTYSQSDSNRATIERHLQEKDDKKAMRHILIELEDKDDSAIDDFANVFIDMCTKQEREYLKNQILIRLYNASVPKQPTGELLREMRQIGVLIGDIAPDFTLSGNKSLSELLPLHNRTVLFFYEYACNLCHDELNKLQTEYINMQTNNVLLISIDCNVTKTMIQPWRYNITDENGKQYIRYGVMKTPTYIIIDNNGTVLQRCYELKDAIYK